MALKFHLIKRNPPVLRPSGGDTVLPAQVAAALGVYDQLLGSYNYLVQTLNEAAYPNSAASKSLMEDLGGLALREEQLWQEYYSLAKRHVSEGGSLHLALFPDHEDPLTKPHPQNYAHLSTEKKKVLGSFLEDRRAALVCFPMIGRTEDRASYKSDLPRRFCDVGAIDGAARGHNVNFLTTLPVRMIFPAAETAGHRYPLIVHVGAFRSKGVLDTLFNQDQIEFARLA